VQRRLTDEPLVCDECAGVSDEAARGWEAHLADVDDDGSDDLVIYCPACAQREFHL
jgi:hypothetical protein